MNELKAKLMSRKLWIAVLTAVIASLAEQLGFYDLYTAIIGTVGGSYVIGQGIADHGSQGQWMASSVLVKDKVKSRKFIGTVLSLALLLFGKKIGIDEQTAAVIGGMVSTYNIGQGIADHGNQGAQEI